MLIEFYKQHVQTGCPLKYRSRLQRMQNALAKITVPQNSSFPIRSTIALLRHLHWLPVDSCISFKLSTTTYKALGSGRPPYLASLLHNYSPPRTMLSSSAKLLTVPRHNLSLSSRAFRIFCSYRLELAPTECPWLLSSCQFSEPPQNTPFQFCLLRPLTPNPHAPRF